MITFRRDYLDAFLNRIRPEFRGVVLDIGGEKINNRSRFTPPREQVEAWTIINTDPKTEPDIEASAREVPLDDCHADMILMAELLEHVEKPMGVLKEACRLLKPGGAIIITMPFLYQIHADPHDYRRWTDTSMEKVLKAAGFEQIEIETMGGVFAVIYDLLRAHIYRSYQDGTFGFKLRVRALGLMTPLFRLLDKGATKSRPYMTTGWAVRARKAG